MRSFKLIFAAMLLLVISACKKGDRTSDISIDEVANIAINAISSDTHGVMRQMFIVTKAAIDRDKGDPDFKCGATVADKTPTTGSVYLFSTFSLSPNLAVTINCNGSQPGNVTLSEQFTMVGEGERMKATDSGNSNIKLDWGSASSPDFILTGTCTRNSVFVSNVNTKASGKSTVVITLNNILKNKNKGELTGEVTIDISGVTNNGNFNYTGKLVLGSYPVLTIGGSSYMLQSDSGIILPRK